MLLVGVCGAVPRTGGGKGEGGEEILLGDVIISKTVVQYDFGRQYASILKLKDTAENSPGKLNKDIGNLLALFEPRLG